MPDILGMYAQSQPDKPGVIDDKPDGTVFAWTYAELDAQSNRIANLLLSLGVPPGPEGPVVRAELPSGRGDHERHQEDRRGCRAAELPAHFG